MNFTVYGTIATSNQMPALRLRLNKSSSSNSLSHHVGQRPSPSNLKTPSAADVKEEWNRKRELKLKAYPPSTNSSISSSSSHDSNDHEHHYLSPLKILSSSHESSPRLLRVNQSPHHGKISPKAALFIFMALTSFTVGAFIHWNRYYYTGPPRCID